MIIKHPKQLSNPPKRIISLVPSISALLHYLGLEKEMIGITKFCTLPESLLQNKTTIGGTKNIHLQKIKELQPDLIICNKEENIKEQIIELSAIFPVWVTDVNNLEDNYTMITDIGNLTGKVIESKQLVTDIKLSFEKYSLKKNQMKNAAYLIWRDPYMTVGGDTFISDMMMQAGFKNVFSEQRRYPTITVEDIIQRECNVVLLSSEPYPFKEKHINELKKYLPNIEIHLVNGIFFSWYGSELLNSAEYFKELNNIVSVK